MFRTTKAAGDQVGEPVSLPPDNVAEDGDDRNAAPAEQIRDFQDLSGQSAGGASALQ